MVNNKVSIIISAFNAAQFISETLESVLNQTWGNLEIIVVNDGSTDDTSKILKSFENRGVKTITQLNCGQDVALNKGYEYCTGDFIKFMDSDDLINPKMIEIQMNVLSHNDNCIAYGEWSRFYNNNYTKADFSKLDYWKDMLPIDFLTSRSEGVMLQCGIMLIPRKILEKCGLWNEQLILFNDTEFFTRVILNSCGVLFSEGARLYYRSGLTNSISAGRSRKYFDSTFLATNLIADHLLNVEDSYRVRNLISNTFFNQYVQFFPKFNDLGKKHEDKIRYYGCVSAKADGGLIFKCLNIITGWKNAKRIQFLFYQIGYRRIIKYKILKFR